MTRPLRLSLLGLSALALLPVSAQEDEPLEAIGPAQELEAAPMAGEPLLFADLSDEEVAARAAAALDQIDTLSARFTQFSPSGAVLEGSLNLARPGRLRVDYDDPNPQLIVAAGGLVYVHDAELETTDSYPVSETPLQFLISRTVQTEAAELKDVIRTGTGVALILGSAEEELAGELALVFRGEALDLVEWAVFEPSGAVTRVELAAVETGQRLPGRLFRVPDSGGRFLDN